MHGLAWELLPPKKIMGNMNANHLEKRKVALGKYLKTIITVFTDLPRPLISFLEFVCVVKYVYKLNPRSHYSFTATLIKFLRVASYCL